jgi:5-hydroxyisourate hydrolase
MGRLTTHVLDTASGRPAAGLRIDLYRREDDSRLLLDSVVTNDDGRVDAPLLDGTDMVVGRYELVFHAGAYLGAQGISLPDPPFLDEIVIAFGLADTKAHYHVPLLLSPYGYSTYRGS